VIQGVTVDTGHVHPMRVVTATLPLPDVKLNEALLVSSAKVQSAPNCVIVKFR
jgi:hypothetical protein